MNAQITQLIQDCDECQSLRPSLHDNPQSHPPAVEPMHSVGLNLFECKGHHYLVMIDRFSNYIWVKRLTRFGTDSILKTLDTWFTDYGYPFIIVSDNGLQFRSNFKDYCCLLYTSPSPRDKRQSRMPSSA